MLTFGSANLFVCGVTQPAADSSHVFDTESETRACIVTFFLLISAAPGDTHPHPRCCHAARRYAAAEIVDKNGGCDLVRVLLLIIFFFSSLPCLRSTSPVCLAPLPGSRPRCDQVFSLKGVKVVISCFLFGHTSKKPSRQQTLMEINPTAEMSLCKGPKALDKNVFTPRCCSVFGPFF